MHQIPKPSKKEVEKYLENWKKLPNYVAQENSLNKLFFDTYRHNTDINKILIKVSSLNDFYSTNIKYVFEVAKHIEINIKNIDYRLKNGDETLVNEITRVYIERKEKNINYYSFATKYCSHHNPEDFPIYDSYLDKILWYFKKTDEFDSFSRKDLKDYGKYKEILLTFKEYYDIDEYSLKDLDRYLWQLGKDARHAKLI